MIKVSEGKENSSLRPFIYPPTNPLPPAPAACLTVKLSSRLCQTS